MHRMRVKEKGNKGRLETDRGRREVLIDTRFI